MYPTGCVPPKFYGLPKIHKPDTPLRPIVSSCGSGYLWCGQGACQNPKTIVEQVKQIKLEPGECLSSYDVSPLFTSVLIDPALNIIKDLLDKDTTLKERTVMEVSDIILLLEFCLKNTYLSFQDQFYEQGWGCCHGFPSQPHCGQSLHGVLRTKSSKHCPPPPSSGTGMWMTPLSSTRKLTNKASCNTSTVLTLL